MNGLHRVVVKTSTTDKGIRQANHFCDEREKVAAFSKDEQVKYTGDMDEKGYENTKRVTTVSKAVGGAAWFFGGQRESDLGGIVGLGAMAGGKALGNAYSVEMHFKGI